VLWSVRDGKGLNLVLVPVRYIARRLRPTQGCRADDNDDDDEIYCNSSFFYFVVLFG
jgi:hypothetical protein